MNVCFLTTSFPAYRGHFQSPFLYQLTRHLQRKGISVDVVCPYYADSRAKEECWEGVRIHRFGFWPTRAGQRLISGGGIPSSLQSTFLAKFQLPFFVSMFFLKGAKVARRCDLIHAQWALSGWVGKWLKRHLKKPLLLTERGAGANLALTHWLTRRILLNVLTGCDFVTANSRNQVEMFRALGVSSTKLDFVANGIDLKMFRPRDRDEARKCLSLPRNRNILLYVGWLIERKGCKYLIRAMKDITMACPDTLLLMVGTGIQETSLKAEIRNFGLESRNVIFIGARGPEEIPTYMNASDLLVLPSLSEGRPNVVGEAMASGLAVVATDVNGTSELVKEHRTGFLVQPRDPVSLAEKVILLLRDKRTREDFGKAARNWIMEQDLTWENTASHFLEIYARLISS